MKNQLRVLRAERGWSQAELSERLGVSRQTVNAIETGRYDPSLPLAFQIADIDLESLCCYRHLHHLLQRMPHLRPDRLNHDQDAFCECDI